MNTNYWEPFLVGGLGFAAGLVAVWTVVKTLEAMRAKLRARSHLYRAALRDARLRAALASLKNADSLSHKEMLNCIAEVERRLNEFSARDRAVLKEGLHQPSFRGVRRFAKELATSY